MLACMNTTDTILTGDCLAVLPRLPTGLSDLAYLDPPFNIGLPYPGYDDRRPEGEYFALLEDVLRAVLRVLSPSGWLWVQCGQTIQAEVYTACKRLGLHWPNSIVWHYTFGPHQKRKFFPSWQMVHGFTVHPQRFTFNDDAVRVPSARQTTYNDKRANPKGRIPDDVWKVSRVCGTFAERVKGHGCQTPLARIAHLASGKAASAAVESRPP
jgi:DNA modification methylase